MLRPKYPAAPTPAGTSTHVVTPTAVEPAAAPTHYSPAVPAPAPAQASPPPIQLTPGSLALLIGGGTTAVVVLGTVLVSLLLAVAITGASVAVCAVVLRSLLNGRHHR